MNFANYLNQKYLLPASFALVVLVLAGGGYFLYQSQQRKAQPLDPQVAQRVAQEEVKKLVSEVGKLIELPSGEDPTVATVTDVSKLQNQPFFAKAKNGDKVLIYTNARKAILYDPITKKVIDVAPINIGSPSAQAVGSKIVLRNGTKISGVAAKVEEELKKVVADLNVIAKENTTNDYDQTVVVVLNSAGSDLAQNLAKVLNASQSALPAGELRPKDGDILILLGKDRI